MAKIPLIITQKIKKRLLEMGFNDVMIKHMKPEEANDILENRLTMGDYVISKSFELLGINKDDYIDIGN